MYQTARVSVNDKMTNCATKLKGLVKGDLVISVIKNRFHIAKVIGNRPKIASYSQVAFQKVSTPTPTLTPTRPIIAQVHGSNKSFLYMTSLKDLAIGDIALAINTTTDKISIIRITNNRPTARADQQQTSRLIFQHVDIADLIKCRNDLLTLKG